MHHGDRCGIGLDRQQGTRQFASPKLFHLCVPFGSTHTAQRVQPAILAMNSSEPCGGVETAILDRRAQGAFGPMRVEPIVGPDWPIAGRNLHIGGVLTFVVDMLWHDAGVERNANSGVAYFQRRVLAGAIGDRRLCLWSAAHSGLIDIALAQCRSVGTAPRRRSWRNHAWLYLRRRCGRCHGHGDRSRARGGGPGSRYRDRARGGGPDCRRPGCGRGANRRCRRCADGCRRSCSGCWASRRAHLRFRRRGGGCPGRGFRCRLVEGDHLRRCLLRRGLGRPGHCGRLVTTDLLALARDAWHPGHITVYASADIDAPTAVNVLLALVGSGRKLGRWCRVAQRLSVQRTESDTEPDHRKRNNSCNSHTCPHKMWTQDAGNPIVSKATVAAICPYFVPNMRSPASPRPGMI